MSQRGRAGVLVALVAAAMGAVLIPGSTSPAYAAEPRDIQVTIESLAPLAPAPGGLLTVSGRVGNRTEAALSGVAVRLRVGGWPLTTRAQIPVALSPGALDGDPDTGLSQWQVVGEPVSTTTTPVTPLLMPGAQADFTLTVAVDSLPLPVAGIYVVGVEALSDYVGDPYTPASRGITRTLLPWLPDPGAALPTGLVWLWPVAGWPDMDGAGVLLGTTTPSELAPDGRLTRLVDVGGSTDIPLTWIVDPQLLQVAQQMTSGYRVLVDGEIVPGEDPRAAADWLDALRAATSTRGGTPQPEPISGLPYADIDVASAQRAGLDRDVVRAISISPEVTRDVVGRRTVRTVEWAPSGNLNDPSIAVLAASGVATLVMAAEALPPDPPVDFTPSGSATLTTTVGTVRAVLRDTALSSIMDSRPTTDEQVLQARQRFLSETAMASLELPESARTLVVAPTSVRWDPPEDLLRSLLSAAARVPWIAPRSFDSYLASPASTVARGRVDYGIEQRELELPQSLMARNAASQVQLSALADVLADPVPVVEPLSAGLLRAQSSAWRQAAATGDQLLRRTSAEVQSDTDGVRILSRNSVTLSGESGSIPITIANNLSQAVTVTLRLSATPAARIQAEPITGVTIQPGRKASLEVAVRVVGGGAVPVTVDLLTARGNRFGEPVVIDLRSTAYSRAATWVVVAALIVIAAFVVLGVARRIRGAGSRGEPAAEPAQDAGLMR